MALEYIASLQNGSPGPGRVIAATTTSKADLVRVKSKRMLRIHADAIGAHFAFVHSSLRDEFFNEPNTWQNAALAPDLTEGNRLRVLAGSPWLEANAVVSPNTTQRVKLNKTTPLASGDGVHDVELQLDDQDTILSQIGRDAYAKDQLLELFFNHNEGEITITMDYAIVRHGIAEALNYLQGGGTFTTAANWFTATNVSVDTQVTKTFTCDVATQYGVFFRPTSDQAGKTTNITRVYFAAQAADADPELANGIQEYLLAEGNGHLAVKMDAATGNITIAEMNPA